MTDKEIIKLLAKGENKVFTLLYREYFSMVEYLIIQNNGDRSHASDIFQEVMLVLYEKARDGELYLKASIKTICYSIARNLWLKELRKSKPNVSLQDFEAFIEDETTQDEQEEFLSSDNFSLLKTSLEKMGAPCKPLLMEFYFAKKSLKEIAAKFGYQNTNSVKTQKYKCFRKLQSLMISKR